MNKLRMGLVVVLSAAFIFTGCATWNKTQKGAVVGTAAGGAMGAVIGRASGNTALGAIIGATVGGATGAVIGHQMDKQAEEIKNTVPDAKAVSYTHLRAHETVLDLVCRLLLEKKKK